MKKARRVRIPGFEVQDVLGAGAMATVYRALQTALQRPIALKVLHAATARDDDYRERFLREARAAARLSHGNVVRAYEAGVHEGSYWFAMELVEGEDLDQRLGWCHSLPEAEALDVGVGVARALAAAEEHGLVHRDVKPENVLLAHDGQVKLADLGLAKAQGDASLTAEGVTVGTVAFLSPEQCRGAADLDIRSDLWALGAVLFNALSGELPYGRGENAVVTMKRIVQEEPPALEGRVKASPATLQVVSRLMRRDRDERPASAREALALLEEARARIGQAPGAEAGAVNGSGVRRGTRRARRRSGSVSARVGASVGARGRGRPGSPLALLVPLAVALGAGLAAVLALRGGAAPAGAAARTKGSRTAPTTPTTRSTAGPVTVAAAQGADPQRALPAGARLAASAGDEEHDAAGERLDAAALERLRLGAGASAAEALDGGRVRLSWDLEQAAQLRGWRQTGEGAVGVGGGALRITAPTAGVVDVELVVPLRAPLDVSYRLHLTTPGVAREAVMWTTFSGDRLTGAAGSRLASFAGAALYSVDGGTASHLAGSRRPQAVIGGPRRRVRMALRDGLATGWVDGRERYSHAVDVGAPVRVAFHVERGVAIDVRDLVLEGAPDPAWLEAGR